MGDVDGSEEVGEDVGNVVGFDDDGAVLWRRVDDVVGVDYVERTWMWIVWA